MQERSSEEVARSVIDANRFLTIGSADGEGRPWVSPVWYAVSAHREFLWVSSPEARHSRNLAQRPELAIVIFDSHAEGAVDAVYMSAVAEELAGDELDENIELYSSRSLAQGLPAWSRDDVVPPARHRLYRATVSEHFVLGDGDRRIAVAL
jgi:nitroimidazol reductase NimA-like FMN-containing flavoprotein (pyridoxamine 5'-phosphate oxidase superfamily)